MSTKLSIEKIINHRYNRSSKTLSSAYKFLSHIKDGRKLKEGNKAKLSKDKNITGKKSIISNILFPELNRTNCRPRNRKKKIVNNYLSSKTQKYKLSLSKNQNFNSKNEKKNTFDDFDNIMSTNETESVNNTIQDSDVEKLCSEFKISEFKSAFIIDNNGNSNLNLEQKKIIEDYLYRKHNLENNISECKINNIKVENYHKNDVLFKEKNTSNFDEMKKNNIKHQQKIIPFHINKFKTKPSSKEKYLIKKNIKNNNLLENKINDNESEEVNSLFENYYTNSPNSSFLTSSFGDELALTIQSIKI
jgi:phosphopantetheine adenylyltransferase